MRVLRGEPDGRGRRIAVVVARFNEQVTARLLDGALAALESRGVADGDVTVVWVPGAFEIPAVAGRFATSGDVDAVVCLGAVIRGDTAHFELVAREAARGIAAISRESGIPCAFEVLATDDLSQAEARAGGEHGNRGWDAALTALEMCDLLSQVNGGTQR